jgi:hypothetical protein
MPPGAVFVNLDATIGLPRLWTETDVYAAIVTGAADHGLSHPENRRSRLLRCTTVCAGQRG